MSDIRKEFKDILKGAESYLMQQEQLCGDIIYKASTQKIKNIATPEAEFKSVNSLDEFNAQISSCKKCQLGNSRKNFVFGIGNPNAKVMFVGEAPGADEDAQGEPFVGRAGQLLNKILEAVQLKREDVYICNILKCRPPDNRDPMLNEMELCTPYLSKQIELIKPKFIICLGRIAAQWLLKTSDSLTAMRQKVHNYQGAKLIVTYHPAALLRNPNWKRPTWEDMQLFQKLYNQQK